MLRVLNIAACAALLAVTTSCSAAETTATATKSADAKSTSSEAKAKTKSTKTPGGTTVEDLVVGTGAEVTPGSTAVVHYVGTLQSGCKFDSSRDRNEPFPVEQVGRGPVIRGWNEGLLGMKVGGKRKLTIPPDQAYGPRAMPDRPPYCGIPANSTLIFEIELLQVQ